MSIKKSIFLFIIFPAVFFMNNIFYAEEEKKVLILNSYHIGYEWSDSELNGVQDTLKKRYKKLDLYFEYMDTKRFSFIDENDFLPILEEQFELKYNKDFFDGIITLDNAAFNFVLKYQDVLFRDIPIIFCGVNYFEDKMIEGRKNITGVVEFVDFRSAIDVIFKIQPGVENIYVINDLSLSSRINRQIISDIAKYYAGRVNFVFIDKNNTGLSLDELLSELAKLNKADAVFCADFSIDKNKKAYLRNDIFPKISKISKAPIYDNDDSTLGLGIIGGKLNSGYYHGQTAANLLIDVFNGKLIKDIPVVKEAINKYMFDYKQLKRFDIKISKLPQDSIIINKPTVFYKIYSKELATGLIIIAILIIFIIILSTSILRQKVAESSLSNLFESLPDMVKIHDLDGKYLYVNKVVCETLGYTNEEIMKMNHKDIDDPSYSNNLNNKFKNHLQNKEYSFEGVYISKKGEKIPVDINTTFIKYHGKIAILTVARNISGRKKSEKEREDLLKKLALKNEELESIIYAASHDLKTPIINIFGFGKELLLSSQSIKDILNKCDNVEDLKRELSKTINEDITQSIKFITKSSLKMEQLLNGLLKVSRLGRVQLDITTIDMNNLIKNIIDSMKFKINETKAFITSSKLPNCIGDVSQINRVFTNLIDNSLKYLNPRKKTLIKISGKKKNKISTYCIEDNGIGIPKDKKEKAFEIFYRFDVDVNPEGEGIGLTIVKKIVEQHNGEIWVNSEEGKGSKFYISLPAD